MSRKEPGRRLRGGHVFEGHCDRPFIDLILKAGLKESRNSPILEMRILRLRVVKVTFNQGRTKTNGPLSWNSDPDSVIPSLKLFLPQQTGCTLRAVLIQSIIVQSTELRPS